MARPAPLSNQRVAQKLAHILAANFSDVLGHLGDEFRGSFGTDAELVERTVGAPKLRVTFAQLYGSLGTWSQGRTPPA